MPSRCSLEALASTPPLVFLFVFRPPAAWASDGPFVRFFSQRSPTFSKLCFTAAQATWLARRSSPYSPAAESCALAKVRCAFAGERLSVPGSSLFLALPVFVVFGITAPFGSLLALPGWRRTHSRRSAHRGTRGEESDQGCRELVGRLLGHVVAAVDPPAAAEVRRPVRPDRPRIAVQLLHVVADRPQHAGGA